jgi:hypothetical protein
VAGVFTLVLTTATFAGDIQTGGSPQPPPTASSTLAPGDIETPGIQNAQAMSDSVADIALNLLQIMLSVF